MSANGKKKYQQPEPIVQFYLELRVLSSGQVAVGTPAKMLESNKGCAMAIDILAKATQVIAAKLSGLQATEESRITLATPGQIPVYKE